MTEAAPRATSETSTIAGPAGELEVLIDVPATSDGSHVAVICHPHPLQGGAMTNKVVHMLAKSFNAVGTIAVRFNFRGVGRSAGEYSEGVGETLDALAVLDWAHERWPGASLSLAGFSFGGAVAIRAASERAVHRLITVAPAVDRVDVPTERLPRCPWLVIQGDEDEVVDPQHVRAWIQALATPPELVLLSGVGHFFHGRLSELKNVVVDWLRRHGA
jgi:alpha/beta superfamily hydrolase